MTAPTNQTILDVLDSNFHGIAALTGKLAGTDDSFDVRVETAELVREIVQHHVAAEQLLHPLISRSLPDGERIAHQQFAEHRELESELRRLEDLEPATPQFRQVLSDVRQKWLANASYLDTEIFPTLRSTADEATLLDLGDRALGAQQSGPTRPRSLATENPSANTALSIAQGFVDKTIDAFGHRGNEGTDEIDARLRAGRYDDIEN